MLTADIGPPVACQRVIHHPTTVIHPPLTQARDRVPCIVSNGHLEQCEPNASFELHDLRWLIVSTEGDTKLNSQFQATFLNENDGKTHCIDCGKTCAVQVRSYRLAKEEDRRDAECENKGHVQLVGLKR